MFRTIVSQSSTFSSRWAAAAGVALVSSSLVLASASSRDQAAQCEPRNEVAKSNKGLFSWPELEAGIRERMSHERELRVVSANAKQRLAELNKQYENRKVGKEEFETKFETIRKEVVDRAQNIVWGATGREEFLNNNGCVKINKAAIDAIKALRMKVVEMGAGSGHWAKALKDAGVDIVAFDSMEALPQPKEMFKFPVKQEDISVLKKYKDRALLLVYPPPGPMAEQSLAVHESQVVIYCGEGRNGANASNRFFDELEANFTCETVITEFERFGQKSFERMWIMRRKKI